MSVVVDSLTKIYDAQKVLDDVSFEAPKGKITGFLGTNGAGKSTTMKIAAGYVSLTSGQVLVNGLDVNRDIHLVRQITGYLPEHNPLYLEMYVKEYLNFIASAYKIKDRKIRVNEMVALCGLEQECKKKIRALSKGYRQRVGLAQTLIHDPEVLILDEPTGGLDPNQLIEVRKIIKEASQEKTVIMSTHIMQEVEAICDKVVIINKGKLVADDQVAALKNKNADKISYQVAFEEAIDEKLFTDAGLEVEVDSKTLFHISGNDDLRKVIMRVAGEHALPLINISKKERSLETIFQELTK